MKRRGAAAVMQRWGHCGHVTPAPSEAHNAEDRPTRQRVRQRLRVAMGEIPRGEGPARSWQVRLKAVAGGEPQSPGRAVPPGPEGTAPMWMDKFYRQTGQHPCTLRAAVGGELEGGTETAHVKHKEIQA